MPPADSFPADWPRGSSCFTPRRCRLPDNPERYYEFFDRLLICRGAHQAVFADLKTWRSVLSQSECLMRGTPSAWRRLTEAFLLALLGGIDGRKKLFKDTNMFHEDLRTDWQRNRAGVVTRFKPVVEEMLTYIAGLWFKPMIMCDDGTVKPSPEDGDEDYRVRRRAQRSKNATARVSEEHTIEMSDEEEILNARKRPRSASPLSRHYLRRRKQEKGPEQLAPELTGSSSLSAAERRLEQLESMFGELKAEFEGSKKGGLVMPDQAQNKDTPPSTRPGSTHTDDQDHESDTATASNGNTPCPEEGKEGSTAAFTPPFSSTRPEFPTGDALAARMMRYVFHAQRNDPEAWHSFKAQLAKVINSAKVAAMADRMQSMGPAE